nr:vegetative cell wall protein gp1-like [Aedes albopictus]
MESIPQKSLPDMHCELTLNPSHTLDENRSDCVRCDRRNGEDSMVQCDTCQTWWHFACAGVTDSINDRSWSCPKCQVDDLGSSVSHSRRSRTSNSSVKSARVNLQLEKLEELQAMKEKFIEEKYKLLESQLEGENESIRSKRSRVSKQTSLDKVANWVNKCAEQKDDVNVPTSTNTESPLPPAHSGQSVANARIDSEHVPDEVQLPDGENQQSPLKHPSLPKQRSAPPATCIKPAVEYTKTGPNQGDDPAKRSVFNKLTGTVPLAQSTPGYPSFAPATLVLPTSSVPTVVSKPSAVPSIAPVYSFASAHKATVTGSVSAPPPPSVVLAPPLIPQPAVPSHQFRHHQESLPSTLISAPIPPPMFQAAPTFPPVSVPYHLPTYPVVPSMLQAPHASAPAPALGPVPGTSPAIASTSASSLVPPSVPAAQPASLVREVSFPQPPVMTITFNI